MIYLISICLLLIGTRSIIFVIYRHRRIQKVEKLINFTNKEEEKKSILIYGMNVAESQLDKTFKKNSKIVSFTSELDQNIKLKGIIFGVLGGSVLAAWSLKLIDVDEQMLLVIMMAILSVIIILPARIQAMVMNHHSRKISNDIPYAIDLLAVCIQSGMTVEAALAYIANKMELINKDLSSLLVRTVLRADVSGINSALEQLSSEIKNEEIRMLCSALLQSTKFGSSIYAVLIDISKEIRQMQLLAMEEKVAALSSKMTFPMIAFILFPLIAIVAGPGFIKMATTW